MAHDSQRNRTVLFQSNYASVGTWEWDGTSWSPQTNGPQPPSTETAAMCYDSSRGRCVLVNRFGELWEWDGMSWQNRNALQPNTSRFTALAYDSARKRVVKFGGDGVQPSFNAITAEWDGLSWTTPNLIASPPPRAAHAMAYDAAR